MGILENLINAGKTRLGINIKVSSDIPNETARENIVTALTAIRKDIVTMQALSRSQHIARIEKTRDLGLAATQLKASVGIDLRRFVEF